MTFVENIFNSYQDGPYSPTVHITPNFTYLEQDCQSNIQFSLTITKCVNHDWKVQTIYSMYREDEVSVPTMLRAGYPIQLTWRGDTRFIQAVGQNHQCKMSHVMRKPVLAICEQQRHRSACASIRQVFSWRGSNKTMSSFCINKITSVKTYIKMNERTAFPSSQS